MKAFFVSLWMGSLFLPVAVSAAPIVNQSQLINNTNMANFSQSDLAQSFQQSVNNISGASIITRVGQGSGTTTITIGLYDMLPNNGGSLLATGSTTINAPGETAQVFWTPLQITPGQTYYLVFTSTVGGYAIGGSLANPYSFGNVFANPGYESFANNDYAFQTFAESTFDGAPELSADSAATAMFFAMSYLALVAKSRRPAGVTLS